MINNPSSDQTVSAVALAQRYLGAQRDLQIATVSETGRPWIFTCWYAINDRFEAVFMSKDHRRHSRDILATRLVAATAVHRKSTLGEPVQSVTLEGRCRQIGEDGIEEAYARFTELFPKVRDMLTPMQLLDDSHPDYLWVIEPESVVLFDEVNFAPPDQNPRQEIHEW